MRYLLLFFMSVISLSIASCSLLGPKYVAPKVSLSNEWQINNKNFVQNTSSLNTSDMAWWHDEFNDLALDQLVSTALQNNNDIQIALGNITVASGKLKAVRMQWYPDINLTTSLGINKSFNNANSFNNPMLKPLLANNDNQVTDFYNLGLMPSYTLNIFQQMKQQEIAKLNLSYAKIQKDAVRLAIISQVTGAYITLLSIDQQQIIIKNMIKNLESIISMLDTQLAKGLIVNSDMLEYKQKLNELQMQLLHLENNSLILTNTLKVLVNNDEKFAEIINKRGKFDVINIKNSLPINLPSMVLNNRPDIMQAIDKLKIANANIGLATSNFFPKIMLTSPLGFYNTNVSNLFASSGDYWALQAAAVMPVLNLSLYGIIKESKGQYYMAYYQYIKVVKSAFAEVNNSMINYDSETKLLTINLDSYNLLSSKYADDNLKYDNGYMSKLELLVDEISTNEALLKLILGKHQKFQAVINFYQNIAAGYNYANTEQIKKFNDAHDI